jgi:hypothetical protein
VEEVLGTLLLVTEILLQYHHHKEIMEVLELSPPMERHLLELEEVAVV